MTDQDVETYEMLNERQEKSKFYYDRTVKNEQKFNDGDIIRYRDSQADKVWKTGQILKAVNDRSYELVNSRNNIIRRNSRLLIPDKTRKSLAAEPDDVLLKYRPQPHLKFPQPQLQTPVNPVSTIPHSPVYDNHQSGRNSQNLTD